MFCSHECEARWSQEYVCKGCNTTWGKVKEHVMTMVDMPKFLDAFAGCTFEDMQRRSVTEKALISKLMNGPPRINIPWCQACDCMMVTRSPFVAPDVFDSL